MATITSQLIASVRWLVLPQNKLTVLEAVYCAGNYKLFHKFLVWSKQIVFVMEIANFSVLNALALTRFSDG